MVKDLDRPKEPAKERAERRWKNNALRQKYKAGKMPFVAIVDPDTVDYVNEKIHLPKDAQPEPAQVIENADPKVQSLERKFVKEIRALLEGHQHSNIALYAAHINHQRRILLKEKIRRLEASIAQHEGSSNG